MGLDMYLYAQKHITGYDFYSNKEKSLFQNVLKASGLENYSDPDTPSGNVSVVCMYWRKANAIHAWFVDNVQHGKDECQLHDVSAKQLHDLIAAIDKSLAGDHSALSPRGGFFFGSVDIDEWYFNELRRTKERLTILLEAGDDVTFQYCSSW